MSYRKSSAIQDALLVPVSATYIFRGGEECAGRAFRLHSDICLLLPVPLRGSSVISGVSSGLPPMKQCWGRKLHFSGVVISHGMIKA